MTAAERRAPFVIAAEGRSVSPTAKVLVDVAGALITVTMNRPEARNAVDRDLSHEVCAAIDHLDATQALRVGILTGAGGNFCSGMDLKAFVRGEAVRVDGRGLLGLAYTPPVTPLIAAVEGYCLAGGFEATLACDLMVAAHDARFGLPEAKRGLAAAAGGLIRLPRTIPPRIAMEIALTGDHVDAELLYRHGLVNALAEPGHALEAAVELARRIAGNAPLSLAASKRVITEQRNWNTSEDFDRQADITAPVLASQDAKEGARAFAEKRAPQWSGA